MDFETFTRRAERILTEVPPEYMEGIVGVRAHRELKEHPHIVRYYTLGECEDDTVARLAGGTELRSLIHLYYGSFLALSRPDPEFDWERELSETIFHEVRHHIEDRAGLRDLADEDAEQEALARFSADEEMPDGWYRAGEELEPGSWRVGDDLFVEVRLRPGDLGSRLGAPLALTVLEEPFVADLPEDLASGDVLSFEEEGLEREDGSSGDLHLIVVEG